jgi:hypothetical protein
MWVQKHLLLGRRQADAGPKFKFSTIVARTDVIITHAHAAWFTPSFGVLLGFHINVGTEFVPNTRLDPLIERLRRAY